MHKLIHKIKSLFSAKKQKEVWTVTPEQVQKADDYFMEHIDYIDDVKKSIPDVVQHVPHSVRASSKPIAKPAAKSAPKKSNSKPVAKTQAKPAAKKPAVKTTQAKAVEKPKRVYNKPKK